MPEILGKVLHPVQKSARISGNVSPTGVKSKPNLRHDIPTGVRSELNPRHNIPTGVKSEQNPRHNIPTGVKSEKNLRQGFTPWGTACRKSQA